MQYNPPVSVLLLGATGFIGSYVLRALLAEGHQVTAIRRKHDSRTPIPMQLGTRGQLQWLELALHNHTKVSDWMPRLEGIDVTINCIGILRQRFGENYNDIHHLMPAALAQACAKREVRLLHTSALGLHEQAKSRFLSSKLLGEKAIAASRADYCIVRPSLIDGLGGFGASWLRMLASWPVHFVPAGAVGKIAAVQATDLGLAFAALVAKENFHQCRDANLGGERLFGYAEFLQLLRGVEQGVQPALQIPLPDWIARIGSHLCDMLRFSPFSYGHWILLQQDNVPRPNHLPALLERAPLPVTYTRVALRDDFRLS